MPRPNEEDLFKDSTMTFGEHLEELRACLFRALFGLVIGVIAGLFLGQHVVDWIKDPMQTALIRYYTTKSVNKVDELTNESVALGVDDQRLKDFIEEYNVAIDTAYVMPWQVLGEVSERTPNLAPPNLPNPADDDRANDGNGGDPGSVDQTADTQDDSKPQADLDDEEKEAAPALTFDDLYRVVLLRPISEARRSQLTTLNAQEGFMVFLKASIVVGLLLSSPWVFYQIWQFVAAGLYPHEKNYVHVFLPISLLLFLAGAALAYFFVFRFVLDFLLGFNQWLEIDPEPRLSEWLGFVLMLPVGFGIGFQLPLVMLFLERIGIFTIESYLSSWRVAILVIFVVAMFLTPADPWSMFLMAVPMSVLYFGGVAMCKYMPKPKSPFDTLD